MTLTLTPDAEARLRSFAAQHSLLPEEAVVLLLDVTDASGYYNPAEAEIIVAELQASVEDHAAGRSLTIDKYRTKALASRQVRDCG